MEEGHPAVDTTEGKTWRKKKMKVLLLMKMMMMMMEKRETQAHEAPRRTRTCVEDLDWH